MFESLNISRVSSEGDEEAEPKTVYKHIFLRKSLMLLKTAIYFNFIIHAQVSTMKHYYPQDYSSFSGNLLYHYKIYWIVIEVLFFYLNIMAVFLFIVITRWKSFYTMRERAGYGGNLRRVSDFLEHCAHDIHWFTIEATQLGLLAYVTWMRSNFLHKKQEE